MAAIFSQENNVFFQAQIGSGKTLVLLLAMAHRINRENQNCQAIFLGANVEAVYLAQKRFNELTHSTISNNAVSFDHKFSTTAQVMFGTPIELAKLIANSSFYTNDIQILCCDDADLTTSYENSQSLISRLQVQVVACSSTMVQIQNAINFTINRRNVLSTQIGHFYVVEDDWEEKLKICYRLANKLDDNQAIVFCPVNFQWIFISWNLYSFYNLYSFNNLFNYNILFNFSDKKIGTRCSQSSCENEFRIIHVAHFRRSASWQKFGAFFERSQKNVDND